MDQVLIILAFLVGLVGLYFTYMIVNVVVTIIKDGTIIEFISTNPDHSLKFCMSPAGKAFYIGLTVLYFVVLFGCIAFMISTYNAHKMNYISNALSVWAIYSIIYSMQIANLVLVGRKNMLVGRLLIDYRKMKKINFNTNNEITFVFAQKNFRFSTRWVDKQLLRKAVTGRS